MAVAEVFLKQTRNRKRGSHTRETSKGSSTADHATRNRRAAVILVVTHYPRLGVASADCVTAVTSIVTSIAASITAVVCRRRSAAVVGIDQTVNPDGRQTGQRNILVKTARNRLSLC